MGALAAAGALFSWVLSGQQPAGPQPEPFRSGSIAGWRVKVPGGRPLASPAIADGKIFVGGGFGSHEFYAFDAATGKPLWTYHTADDGPTAAVVEDGHVAFNTESCELETITTNGRPVWKKWLGDPLMSMPAIHEGKVFMAYPDSRGTHRYYLAAFDLKTGAELWKHPLANEVITAPIVDNDRIYAATLDGSMLALTWRDGLKVWEEAKNATSAPAVWNGQVYFSRREATKIANGGKPGVQQTEMLAARPAASAMAVTVDMAATRKEADYLDYNKRQMSSAERKSQSMDAMVGFGGSSKGAALIAPAQANLGQASVHGIWAYQGSKPFASGGRLYSSMGDETRSTDIKTGKVIWSRKMPAKDEGVLSPPAIVNGKVFVGTASGEVYALSASTGDVLWKAELGEPVAFQPIVANGRVCVGTNSGSLYCLNTGDARDDGWPMWGGSAAHNGR
jgi:Ca-activated chloride channel family protein